MCITLEPAKLSKTKILSFRKDDGNHILAYANKVKNTSGKPNAMILPVPGTLSSGMFYNTKDYNNFLDDIEKAITPRTRGLSMTKGISIGVEDFTLGMYRILISKNIYSIKEVLDSMGDDERPELSEDMYNFFATNYDSWSFVICCFQGDKEISAQPIMFEYVPFDPNILYFPGVDAHNGNAPVLGENVDVDHTLMTVDLYAYRSNYKVDNIFSQKEKLPVFLLNHYAGIQLDDTLPNGDWYLDIRDIIYDPINRQSFERLQTYPGQINL